MSSKGWASPRPSSPKTSPLTAESLREELSVLAQGKLAEVATSAAVAQAQEQLARFAQGPFREELKGLEERIRQLLRAELSPQADADHHVLYRSEGPGSNFRASSSMMASRSTMGSMTSVGSGATDWVTKRRMNDYYYANRRKKQRSTRIRSRQQGVLNPESGHLHDAEANLVSHPSAPSYTGLPLLDGGAPGAPREDSIRREESCTTPFMQECDSDGIARLENGVDGRSSMQDYAFRGRFHAASNANRRLPDLDTRETPDASTEVAPRETRSGSLMLVGKDEGHSEDGAARQDDQDRGCLECIVYSNMFEYFSCLMVFLNAVALGVETDFLATHVNQALPMEFRLLDGTFCLWFLMELVARIAVQGKVFFCGEGCVLNLFDTALVILQVADETVHIMHMGSNDGVRLLRNFRIIRFLRILRLTRVLSFIGELRTLVVSIACSIKSLVWVIILLGMLTYSFGIFVTHVVISQRAAHEHSGAAWEGEEELIRWYGSVVRSMLSLFEAVSEGVHWAEVMDPLVQYCSPWFALAFLCYIVFALFALLNVVTGLFVEAAIATATEDKKVVLMQQMCQMFLDCDDDQSGTVSWEEFKEHLHKPEMETYLKELDIDKTEAPILFHLLDGDGSGEIGAEELVGGCLRLHGSAKALELAAFMHEFRQFGKLWAAHAKCVEEALHLRRGGGGSLLAPVSEVSEEC